MNLFGKTTHLKVGEFILKVMLFIVSHSNDENQQSFQLIDISPIL